MKKNIRIMIITVAAVIILVAMLLILMNLPSSDGGGASSTASSTSISLNTKTADDVSKVEVKNNSDSYTVEMKSEDSYSVEGLDGFDLNKTSISALKSDSAGVAATQLVEEQAEDLSIYGLDSPKAEATITYKDGETLSLAVGNEAAGDAGTYVTVNGESKVYLFNSAKVDTFAYPLLEYVSKEITPSQEEAVAAANGGEVSSSSDGQTQTPQFAKMTLSGTVREEPIVVEPAEAISGISQFNITSPKEKAADYTKISEYVGAVYGLTADEVGGVIVLNILRGAVYGLAADEVVAVNPTDADLESFGLKEPYSKIVADFDVGTVTLLASSPDAAGNVYVMNGDRTNVVYRIEAETLTWLSATYTDLASKLLFTPNIKDVKTMTVTTPDKTYVFNLTSVVDEDNENSFTTTITYEGKELDEEIFKDYYQNMISVSTDEETTEQPTGDPIFSVKYEYADTSRTPDVVEFYDAGSRRVFIVFNGKCDSLTVSTYVDKMVQDSEKVVNGEEITAVI